MRSNDRPGANFMALRQPRGADERIQIDPGHVFVSAEPYALAAVLTSTVAVTLYDKASRRGGVCVYARAKAAGSQASTAFFGPPALAALLKGFSGISTKTLVAGIYGGASAPWSSSAERQLARENVTLAEDTLAKAGIEIADKDVGGERGRRFYYLTSTNEVAVLKTEAVRKNDWFPMLPRSARVS